MRGIRQANQLKFRKHEALIITHDLHNVSSGRLYVMMELQFAIKTIIRCPKRLDQNIRQNIVMLQGSFSLTNNSKFMISSLG